MNSRRSISVLIVDDDAVFRNYVRNLLEVQQSDEWICEEAACVHDAVDLLAKKEFCLAIIDVHLPDGTALDVIRKAGQTPCILCTQDDKKPTFLAVFINPLISENIVGFLPKSDKAGMFTSIRAQFQVGQERKLRNRLVAEATAAMEQERCEIANNLHDAMGASLTRLTWVFNRIDKLAQGDIIEKDLAQEISEMCKQGLGFVAGAHYEVSAAVTQLLPEIVSVAGLNAAIRYMIGEWEQAAPSVHFVCDLDTKITEVDQRKAGVLYRLVQEGITNAMRHGKPLSVSIEMACGDNYIQLRIHSKGSVREQETYPLTALRERTSSLGGMLQFECSQITGESNLLVTIPIFLPEY